MYKQKRCPVCNKGFLVSLSTLNIRICSNGKCAKVFTWTLKKGQKSLLIKGLKGDEYC